MRNFVLIICLFTSSAFATPSLERVAEIRQVVEGLKRGDLLDGVELKVNSKLPGPAWARITSAKTFVIEYNPDIYMSLNRSGRDFIMFHELGHIRLGHAALPYPGAEGAREYELEADTFATYAWRRFQQGTNEELKEFFDLIKEMPTTPSGKERVELCEVLLRGL